MAYRIVPFTGLLLQEPDGVLVWRLGLASWSIILMNPCLFLVPSQLSEVEASIKEMTGDSLQHTGALAWVKMLSLPSGLSAAHTGQIGLEELHQHTLQNLSVYRRAVTHWSEGMELESLVDEESLYLWLIMYTAGYPALT